MLKKHGIRLYFIFISLCAHAHFFAVPDNHLLVFATISLGLISSMSDRMAATNVVIEIKNLIQ